MICPLKNYFENQKQIRSFEYDGKDDISRMSLDSFNLPESYFLFYSLKLDTSFSKEDVKNGKPSNLFRKQEINKIIKMYR